MSFLSKIIYLPKYIVSILKLKFYGVQYGKGFRGNSILLLNKGSISLGKNVSLNSYPDGILNLSGIKTYTENAKVTIGDDCIINGTMIYCVDEVIIGKTCMFGPGTKIVDNDSHRISISIEERRKPPVSKPIIIKDNVWIGMDCLILKGVTIGENAIVAARTIVTKDVLPNTLVGGNPTRVIKNIIS